MTTHNDQAARAVDGKTLAAQIERARALAAQFRSHPVSRSIDEIEEAGELLYALAAAPAVSAPIVPAGWVIRDRSDLEPGAIDIDGPDHPRLVLTTDHVNPALRRLYALACALGIQAPATAPARTE